MGNIEIQVSRFTGAFAGLNGVAVPYLHVPDQARASAAAGSGEAGLPWRAVYGVSASPL